MDVKFQRPKSKDGLLSSLNTAIDAMNIAKDVMGITPAKAVFASVSVILTMIKVVPFRSMFVYCWLINIGLRDE